MPDQLLLVLAALLSNSPESIRVGLDQVPPGSKCVQSAVLAAFVGQPASAQLGAQLMAASRAPRLRWVGARTTGIPKDSKLLVVRLDSRNRVVSATCAGAAISR